MFGVTAGVIKRPLMALGAGLTANPPGNSDSDRTS